MKSQKILCCQLTFYTFNMTPKEQAIELLDDYTVIIDGNLTYEQVKQCALIAVHEIIKNWINEAPIQYPYGKVINYWLDVKNEIEKL